MSPFYGQDEHVLLETTTRVGQHEETIPLHISETLALDQQSYAARLGSILCSSNLARGPFSEAAMCLEYAPWVRRMAEFEEAQHAALTLEENTHRRRTRNSQKSKMQSWLSLDTERRQALLHMGFSA